MIITIDGAVATGKSTVAKHLARSLGYIYFDTGAMYRAVTWSLLKQGIDWNDPAALEEFLKNFHFDIKVRMGEKYYYVDDHNVTDEIRKPEVTKHVSSVSALPAVREKLTSIQRELSLGVNSIFEGRDMGTVVFPNADLKIFLTGDPKVRAERRYQELVAKFPELKNSLTLESVLEDLNTRDAQDSNREHSPLKKADDCFLVDTTGLSIDEVCLKILECKDRLKKR